MEGPIAFRRLNDGRELYVYPLLFNRARLGVGQPDVGAMDDVW